MQTENPDELTARLRADDKSVLKDLFERYYNSVCQAIFGLVRERNQTEDLAQNVFIRFWEKRHKIEIRESYGAYFRKMAVNEALMFLRKNNRWHIEEIEPNKHTQPVENVERTYLQNELSEQINNAINTLPPKCRTVFLLSRFEDLTYKEIAEKMGISVKTVENQMGKALRVLRREMKDYLNR